MHAFLKQPAFLAVREFADLMLAFGRDDYGPKQSPLFAGQLNAETRRIPAGTPADPGLLADNREVAGCGPACQNLLFDLGLLDTLKTLSAAAGDPQYEAARRGYLDYYFKNCRDPRSGYFPWGEHVGYDLVKDAIRLGEYKGGHEVKGLTIPWDDFWEIDPAATRHEIETAFFNHVCDLKTFAFNRHARMDGTPNLGSGACSLAGSGGLYLQAWGWLYRKTGERKFLDWARSINRLYWDARSPTTNLFPSSEDRPDEMWYGDVLDYACLLLGAAEILGTAGAEFRRQALVYMKSYHQYACDPAGPGIFDTINIVTGKPVIGPSKHYPDLKRQKYLLAWGRTDNAASLVTVAVTTGSAYAATGDAELRSAFDRTCALLDIPAHIQKQTPMVAGDVAGVIAALVHVGRRSGEGRYLEQAGPLADYILNTNCRRGLFTSGLPGDQRYYSARLGSGDLAAALLGYALAVGGRPELIPPVRNPYGAMAW
jgi:hypothetical protein